MNQSPAHHQYLEKAIALIEFDRPKEAISHLTKFLAQEPDHFEAICFLSECFCSINEAEKGLKYANRAVQLDPTHEWGYQLQSLAYSGIGRFQECLLAAKQAIKISPESKSSLTRLMNAYINCEMMKEAWQTGEKIRSLYPTDWVVFVDMGYILIKQKRFDQAEWYLNEAIKIKPNCSMALNNLAVVYENKNMIAKALKFYELSLQADPQDNIALKNIERLSMQNVSLYELAPSLRNHLVAKKAKETRDLNTQTGDNGWSSGCLFYLIVVIVIQLLVYLSKSCH